MTEQRTFEELLEDLADSLQISPSRYDQAEKSYHAVGQWLQREKSSLSDASPEIYIQGSFRLGTVIKPQSEAEDYDVDLVCEVDFSKLSMTQEELKALLGKELQLYAESRGMQKPEEGRRCWTLNYSESAQFHLDTLPAVPDGKNRTVTLAREGLNTTWSDTSIAITDLKHRHYRQLSPNWPNSNPKGYANWFVSRMQSVFDERRRALALNEAVAVEKIPTYRVRTPLQSAIQILKHHRDQMFESDPDNKPISIILTTLAAHAYQQETQISAALQNILQRMPQFVEKRNGGVWIENPTNPTENFADKWQEHPERRRAFERWLKQATEDFLLASGKTRDQALDVLKPSLGERLVEAAKNRRKNMRSGNALTVGYSMPSIILDPAHRKLPLWPIQAMGAVDIKSVKYLQNGFRPQPISSDDKPLPKGVTITFVAETNIPKPFKVFWQVVNTGYEATSAHDLRGGFFEVSLQEGRLIQKERTRYRGVHAIECFIVKDATLCARSGQFIVNIG